MSSDTHTGSLFIVIEGLDGAGGTTQCRLLQSWLERQGHTVVSTNEPTDLPVGKFIRGVLQDPHSKVGDEVLAYLFAADRQDHWMVESNLHSPEVTSSYPIDTITPLLPTSLFLWILTLLHNSTAPFRHQM